MGFGCTFLDLEQASNTADKNCGPQVKNIWSSPALSNPVAIRHMCRQAF